MTIKIETDVLIVGGGGAGSRAAIEADRHGAKVVMAVKGKLGINAMRGAGATGVVESICSGISQVTPDVFQKTLSIKGLMT